jgi:hypothetical protein
LNEIIAMHEARGIMIADPHVFTLEDGTRHKRADADQLAFKRRVDPYGLLNPGKMRSFVVIARNAAFTHKGSYRRSHRSGCLNRLDQRPSRVRSKEISSFSLRAAERDDADCKAPLTQRIVVWR